MTISLSGKVTVVTGSSRAIGRSIAVTLAASGATVVVNYSRDRQGAEEAVRACGKSAFAVQADVSKPGDCRRLIETVIAHTGRIDILINNAAIAIRESFELPYEQWLAQWQQQLDTNLMGAVHTSYWAVKQMKRQGGGKIINVASRSAFRAETEFLAYAVSKAGMVNYTRCLARALANDGILAYAVAPGFIEAGLGIPEIAEHGDAIRAQIPSGRIGTAEDVANVVLFLASDLSNYITGSTIDVNGGSYLH